MLSLDCLLSILLEIYGRDFRPLALLNRPTRTSDLLPVMSHDLPSRNFRLPAPCIIDTGTVVDKQDMKRLLTDLDRVRYVHTDEGTVLSEGEGCILEVIVDPQRATLVANHALYINVCSFDYLQLHRSEDGETSFDLVQDHFQLRLIPLSNPLQSQANGGINAAELEAMVAEVLSASLDVQIDDEEHFPF